MNNLFFTSDLHLGHESVITKMGRQGFRDIGEHDLAILDNINHMVGIRDFLYILGDFAWGSYAEKYRGMIKCKNITFIIGNHDKRMSCKKAFGEYQDIKVIRKFGPNGEKAVLCHYPMLYWPGSHHNDYHFYGHEHSNREATMDKLLPDRRSMDVGVDNAYRMLGDYRPFSREELLWFLQNRPGHDPLSFYKALNDARQSAANG